MSQLGFDRAITEYHVQHLTNLILNITVRNRRIAIAKARINGTTFSGHTVRTTLGNSLRVLMYVSYIFHKAGYKGVAFGLVLVIVVFVAGDDVLIKCSRKARDAFIEVFHRYYAKSTEPQRHGLGQVCKKVNEGDYKYFDFLSREGLFHSGRWFLRRMFSKVLSSGCYSDSNVLSASEHAYATGSSILAFSNGDFVYETIGLARKEAH
jgi:hypothetical protein